MSTTYIDEFALQSQAGPSLTYLSVDQLAQAADAVEAATVEEFSQAIRAEWRVSEEVDDEALERSLRASLALDRLAETHDLGAIALQDVSEELHARMGVRPGLMLPGMFRRRELVVSMEADVAAAVLMFAIRRLAGQPCLYAEPLTYDLVRGLLVMGHAGLADASLADPDRVAILPDFEYKNANPTCGAVNHFVMRPGPVTLANCVYNGERLQFVCLRGESVADSWVLEEGYAHALVRPEIDVDAFFQRSFHIGVSQHWVVAPGDMVLALEQLCAFLGAAYENLASTCTERGEP
jgi:L-arabinose isomerase